VFIKVTRRGPNRYVQLVEAYRDPAGKPKQRTLATLGRLDLLNTELNSVISGLPAILVMSTRSPSCGTLLALMACAGYFATPATALMSKP